MIPCTCRTTGNCHADQHVPLYLKPNEFLDCDGKLITQGTVLRYRNEKHPEVSHPVHTAFVKYGQCALRSDDQEMHFLRKNQWTEKIRSRFKILIISTTHTPPKYVRERTAVRK